MQRLLAIDSGLTITKAVVFDLKGQQLGVSRRNVAQSIPEPRKVERDMVDFWNQTASAIRQVLEETETDPANVIAIAATAHGDGLYLLDKNAQPLGPGILSLDSRSVDVIAGWEADGTSSQSLALTGQLPHVSAPSALLSWIKKEQPERYRNMGHIIGCKDWLRFCLTGNIGTDRTEASTSFSDYRSQAYSTEALALFGLTDLSSALPDVSHSAEVVGTVTATAAAATGLRVGTPVAAGLHDVTASVLGIGAHQPGVVGIVAGTYSINECLSLAPKVDARWFCRNAVQPGRWNNMSISPASTTNYDWFLDTFCEADREKAAAAGQTIHDALAPEINAGLRRASTVLYHPYLFGSPFGAAPSAGFMGVRGWHDRGDMLAAILEGIVFNHRQHVDALRSGFDVSEARLTGGVSRNPTVAQLFADALSIPVIVTNTDEAAAWGAALCAGASVGAFSSFDADPRDLKTSSTTYSPNPERAAHYAQRFETFQKIAEEMGPVWERLNALETPERGDLA
jgi:L-xylulokinase